MAYLSDSQQKAAYSWEEEWPLWNKASMSRQAAERLIRDTCRLYSVPPPKRVVVLRKGKLGVRLGWRTAYDPNDHSLTFAPQHLNPAIVCHETAHLIHSVIAGDEAHEIHGPEWLALYLYLIARFGIAPRIALFASARAFHLKWKSLDKHNPHRIRRTYKALRKREKIDT